MPPSAGTVTPPPVSPAGAPPAGSPPSVLPAAALAAAMTDLGTKLAVLTGAVSASTAALARQRGPVPGGGAGPGAVPKEPKPTGTWADRHLPKVLAEMVNLMSLKMAAVLAPIALLGAAISSATSGFGPFMAAIKVLGATLGTLLLPFFLALGAAVLTVAGYIQDELFPVLEDFYQAVVDGAIEGAQILEAALRYVSKKLQEFGDWLNRNIGTKEDVADWTTAIRKMGAFDTLNSFFGSAGNAATLGAGRTVTGDVGAEFSDILRDVRARDARGGRPPEALGALAGGAVLATGKESFSQRFAKNLELMRQELAFQNTPRAQQSSLVQASRQAQMAGLNMSPVDRLMYDIQQKQLRAAEQMTEVIRDRLKPAVGF